MNTKYEEQICQAVDIILNKRLQELRLDRTIQGVVKEKFEEDKNKYIISYQDIKFEAYTVGPVDIELEDTVDVLIPEGDFANKKIILKADKGGGGGSADDKMDKYQPTGSGYFWMNDLNGTKVQPGHKSFSFNGNASGFQSFAFNGSALGENTVTIGTEQDANGNFKAFNNGHNTVLLGTGSVGPGSTDTLVAFGNVTTGIEHSVCLHGVISSEHGGDDSVAILGTVNAHSAVAIGKGSIAANSPGTVALGEDAKALNYRCVAIGAEATSASFGVGPSIAILGTATGDCSIAIGEKTTVNKGQHQGEYSIAIGHSITCNDREDIAIGYNHTINASNSFSIGSFNLINGYFNGSFGSSNNIYQGQHHYVFGDYNNVSGASDNETILGNNNKIMNKGECNKFLGDNITTPSGTYIDNLVALGNSPSITDNTKTLVLGYNNIGNANNFSITKEGIVYALSSYQTGSADYSEMFEWEDGNINNEDRVGYFVTIENDKIKIANSKDNYILGIISGSPSIIGNGDNDEWNKRFLKDDFNRLLKDEDGNLIVNPDFNEDEYYISRTRRQEWAAVGMVGILPVYQDGSLEVNGYATVNDEGIATKCEEGNKNSYRVIKIKSNKIAEVIFR